ncbi:WD-40 repeat-containing protein [Heterostelium album PN500]|uniref:Oxidation resistance protein 1 n=1 Tax=Heterostelium pallidum (strain ATCC 26659 / Pp 5 / PN500) TaxID=670386 RepID=D3BKY1_HETP5|nr:WD-40 repeat-containing protein [Heterostelium album PN500]EFA78561.1 WD-40 repeat-containing protein [Heterostelium album PN500]|eukprot:XP_020430685.1 WD-40 repeat-containing protein [Heterostelium album PN500]
MSTDSSGNGGGNSSTSSPMLQPPSPSIFSSGSSSSSNNVNSSPLGDNSGRPRSRSSSSTVNINNLFKPTREEAEMAFKSLDPNNQMLQQQQLYHQQYQQTGGTPLTSPQQPKPFISINDSPGSSSSSEKSKQGWASRFAQIPKENVLKEELVCFMKDKKIRGVITLTPYQLIFQSNEKSPTQIFSDYNQIISCKYFPNHTEWLAHLSKDWKKEQYLIQKKNQEKNADYENFIQSEISKLNEMGDEMTTMTINGQVKNVLVFPCIYLLIHKDNYIQTLFFRGISKESVHNCFVYLKKCVSDRKDSSPANGVSPLLGVSPPIGSPIPLLLTPTLPTNTTTTTTTSATQLLQQQFLSTSFEAIDVSSQSPKLVNRSNFNQKIILTPDLYKKLRHYLPMSVQGSDIELQYNTTNDGVSFNTCYRKMRNVPQSILLIKDNGGYIFGAFISDELKPKANFYGSGETFLFKLEPEFQVFKWTKENDLFIYSSLEYISIGGGSMFGLWVDTDFLHGYSGPCETFNNTVLSFKNDFNPVVVEFWAIK